MTSMKCLLLQIHRLDTTRIAWFIVTLFMCVCVFVMQEYKILDGQGLQITNVLSVAIFWGTVKLNESDV